MTLHVGCSQLMINGKHWTIVLSRSGLKLIYFMIFGEHDMRLNNSFANFEQGIYKFMYVQFDLL